MEEQLISFETAKLAKEKGFNELVLNYFQDDKEKHFDVQKTNFNETNHYESLNGILISRPTQSLLQRWLRENHLIHIQVEVDHKIGRGSYHCHIIQSSKVERRVCQHYSIENSGYFFTYEEALEAGLKEALNLIEINVLFFKDVL